MLDLLGLPDVPVGRRSESGIGLLPLIAGVSVLIGIMAAATAVITFQFSKSSANQLQAVVEAGKVQSGWNLFAGTAAESNESGSTVVAEQLTQVGQRLSDWIGMKVTVEDEGGKLNVNQAAYVLPYLLPGLMDPSSVEEAVTRLADAYGWALGRTTTGIAYPYIPDLHLELDVRPVVSASGSGSSEISTYYYPAKILVNNGWVEDPNTIGAGRAEKFPVPTVNDPVKYIRIDDEIISYRKKSSRGFTDIGRAEFGTLQVSHRDFSIITPYPPMMENQSAGGSTYGVVTQPSRRIHAVESLEELANIWPDLLFNPDRWDKTFHQFTTVPTMGVNVNTTTRDIIRALVMWQKSVSLGHPRLYDVWDDRIFDRTLRTDYLPASVPLPPYFVSSASRMFDATLAASKRTTERWLWPRFKKADGWHADWNDKKIWESRPFARSADLVQQVGVWSLPYPLGNEWKFGSLYPLVQAMHVSVQGPGMFVEKSFWYRLNFPETETVKSITMKVSPDGPPVFTQWTRKS